MRRPTRCTARASATGSRAMRSSSWRRTTRPSRRRVWRASWCSSTSGVLWAWSLASSCRSRWRCRSWVRASRRSCRRWCWAVPSWSRALSVALRTTCGAMSSCAAVLRRCGRCVRRWRSRPVPPARAATSIHIQMIQMFSEKGRAYLRACTYARNFPEI